MHFTHSEVMRAMVLEAPGKKLVQRYLPVPEPGPDQVLVKVQACGVCRTDLHIVDGELTKPNLPLVPGHEIIGTIVKRGQRVSALNEADRVGIPWLGYTCGHCSYCTRGEENLCDNALFTGYSMNGGYAEYTVADSRYCFPLPDTYDDAEAAPLLCAGLIGYRSYKMIGREFENLGIYGFGAAAHIITQIAVYHRKNVFAFTKPGDLSGQSFARKIGAVWAGDSTAPAPAPLDAAIIFAPVGPLVVEALRSIVKGGVVVCAGIHMSDIPSFPYGLLWEERIIRSVANLTRRDGEEFLALAPVAAVTTTIERFPLENANEALNLLRAGKIEGAAVLIPSL